MRIALVSPRFLPDIGGVEVHVAQLARRLGAAGHAVDVLTQATGDLPAVDQLHGATVRRFPIRIGGTTYPFAPGLWRYLASHGRDYDVVHAHSYHATAAIPAAAVDVRRLVFTPHYLGSGRSLLARAAHRPYRPVGRSLFRRAHSVVCTTRAEAATVGRDFPTAAAKIKIVANGIDVEAIRNAEPHRVTGPTILCAGRLETYKNVHRVLEALPLLDAAAQVVVVGGGPAATGLERLAARLGVAQRVHFAGATPWPEVYRWFRAADVFVTMSARESFGMTVVEALVAGANVVASDIAAHREVEVCAGAPVLRVPVTASAGELAAAIQAALASPRPGIGRLPSWDDHVDTLLELYVSEDPKLPVGSA